MKGIVLGDRYELHEKIGEGGMSEVFKARDNKLNRFVAVKILKKEFCNNEDIVKKFMGEATAIAMLNDNNIVNVLDVGSQDEINYIVMEYVKGKTLKDVIKQVGKMNYETGISVAIQIAKALDCAHRNQIVHRDVKPQNILVTEDGIMKVTDFGIAKSATSSTIANTTTIMGSAHYLSPEQAKGSFIDCRTDLYSLGVVIYEMVTGIVPFEGDSAVTIALKHIQNEVVPPKEINSRIPESLNKLILKAMEKNPSKRYQTAKEMIADLQKIKENPNAIIGDDDSDDSEHTIIMSAVTDDMVANKGTEKNGSNKNNKINNDDDYDDEEDDDYGYYYDDDDDDYEEKKPSSKKGFSKILIGILCILVIGVAGFAGVKLLGSSSAAQVTVPTLVGKNVDDAKTELEGLKLVLVEAGKEASDEAEGTIIKSNPSEGTSVKENTEIRVIVSSGSKSLTMPDLSEKDLSDAKAILTSFNLTLSDYTSEYSDNVDEGKIIRQTPEKDTEVSSDTKITVVVSKGPKVSTKIVPNVMSLSESDAKAKLSSLGFSVKTTTKTVTDSSQNGIVLAQSVTGGDKATAGTSITITVGLYQAPQASTDESKDQESSDDSSNKDNSGTTNNGITNNGTTNNGTTNNGTTNNGTTNNGTTNSGTTNSGTTNNGNHGATPEGPWDETNNSTNNSSSETNSQANH